jgi:hypothetical protein
MGSAQAEHVLRQDDGRVVRCNSEEYGKGRGLREGIKEGMKSAKTHETSVALLAEVTDGGGRFSAMRPEEFE